MKNSELPFTVIYPQ